MSIVKKGLIRLLILIFGIYLVFVFSRDLFYLLKKGERIKEMEEKAEELRIRNEDLKENLEYVQSDEFIEKEARDKLSMARENEVIVVMPEKLEAIINMPAGKTGKLEQESEEDLANYQKWLKLFF